MTILHPTAHRASAGHRQSDRNAKTAVIWDLDGTLVDSYQMIVPSLWQFYAERGVLCDEMEIRRTVLQSSVRDFACTMEEKTGVSLYAQIDQYNEIRAERELEIRPIPHAAEVLAALAERGVQSFLFTHRGGSTAAVLERTGLSDAFTEVLTAQSGFARKPSPDAINYLVEKYGLDRTQTFYVGDRQLDIECAANAAIRSILFLPPDSPAARTGREDFTVARLTDILLLL